MTKIMATIRANFTIKVVRERDISEVTGFAVVVFIVFSFFADKTALGICIYLQLHSSLFFSLLFSLFWGYNERKLKIKKLSSRP